MTGIVKITKLVVRIQVLKSTAVAAGANTLIRS
jgi:hypothetical protein